MLKEDLKEIPAWWPENPPIYDIDKSYHENLEKGPFFKGTLPQRKWPSKKEWVDFLGFPIAVPLGVPAGPLLNGRWVTFAAEAGFDIVTYKTIRSRPHPAHPLPNMIYVDTKGDLTKERFEETLKRAYLPPKKLENLAATNSFGIPSQGADFLLKDIAQANASLRPGQVMIVSVVGTPRPNEDFVQDFAEASRIAIEGGAKIIEADYSCPNVLSCEGSIYSNPEAIFEISSRIKKMIGPVPLVIKVGSLTEKEVIRKVMIAAKKAGADAICGINTVSMKVVGEDGKSALGENRLRSGVCGSPIRKTALDFTRFAYEVNQEEKLELVIMATGGATSYEHFDLFFEAGADVAMSAVGMLWDPYLAMRYHQKGKQLWKKSR